MVRKLSTRQILEENLSREAPSVLKRSKILLHNIRSMHNVGSVFRSVDAFGISEILLSGYTPIPPRPEITKTAIGAEEHVKWTEIEHPNKKLTKLKNSGFKIIGLEQTDNSIPLPEFQIEKDISYCFVLGNEVTGIDDELLPEIDYFVDIPQFGHKHSLNVSVATGVLLYSILEKSSHLK